MLPSRRRKPTSLESAAWFTALLLSLLVAQTPARGDQPVPFNQLDSQFRHQVRPLLERFCLDCHSEDQRAGELDLERFTDMAEIRRDPRAWQQVIEMLDSGEMPPADSDQLSGEQHAQLRHWGLQYLRAEALAGAGDPGAVVLRRLNNAEYTYTIQDLTGVPLEPAQQFPADSAAGEGFTNTGQSLVMSPALVQKYLDAGKEVASHAVLLPDGIRFSTGTMPRDWTDEILDEIRGIYGRHTTGDPRYSRVGAMENVEVLSARMALAEGGCVDLQPYFSALIRHRDRLLQEGLEAVASVASQEQLNAHYLDHLARGLLGDRSESLLLEALRARWHRATEGDAADLVAQVQAWQDRLWKFNPVGALGHVRPWQEAVTPLASSVDLRVKIEPDRETEEVVLYLFSGSAGSEHEGDRVHWRQPRIERPGKPPLLLRDLRGASATLARVRDESLANTAGYLAAAFASRSQPQPPDVDALAETHRLDPQQLHAWLAWLGIMPAAPPIEHLHQAMPQVAGHDFVKAWGLPDLESLSLVSNASDQQVNIPGDLRPHRVAVHPRPERWVAAGWLSPVGGRFDVTPQVRHAHDACGNGIHWRLELQRGSLRQVLDAGEVDRGGTASIAPVSDLLVRPGDLISLVIDARDRDHFCDLTEIDLVVAERGGEQRTWSLSGDCADDLHAGNPHPDRLGNDAVWHFHTGRSDGDDPSEGLPPDSLVAQWLRCDDAAEAARLADRIAALLQQPPSPETPEVDAAVARRLRALGGPLFASVDLTRSADPDGIEASPYGLDPAAFGRHADGSPAEEADLIVRAPAVIPIRLPASLVAGADFVASAGLWENDAAEGSVQALVSQQEIPDPVALQPDAPVIVQAGSPAEARYQQALDDFRDLFPAAMCHARIVPVDEVVTLVLFHREDHHLARLMLDEGERARLDRLWDELRYVSQDALRVEVALEQILEFATQDADPKLYDPVREPIRREAAAFRQRLEASEPAHLDALLAFAARAYRRPLSESQASDLRSLYERLRGEGISHDDAWRLTLARVLASPAFLYRIEQPGEGAEPVALSDEELATRLSYFLWSSLPDEALRQQATAGRLHEPQVLKEQTRRMLTDPRSRRLAIEFACQWLHLRDFDTLDEKSERHFPEFAELRGDMYEETILFFTDLFRNDGSVLDILDADHTFLNGRLAEHYGLAIEPADSWQRVTGLRSRDRGGVLGQASVLARQSGASRTSPILRGNWVVETLLGERLPRPPQDVPQLDDAPPDGLTERELIERHSSDAACARCHVRIDPYGFALESFDAIGRQRQQDASGRAIDTRTTLPDGTELDGPHALRAYLLQQRREDFLRQFCRKLLGYALGRSTQLSDEPLLDAMMEQLAARDYQFSAAVETIVLSEPFRTIRGRLQENITLGQSDQE